MYPYIMYTLKIYIIHKYKRPRMGNTTGKKEQYCRTHVP